MGHRRLPPWVAGVLLLLAIISPQTSSAAPAALCSSRLTVPAGSTTLEVPYCANVDLQGPTLAHREAVVVVHGSDRNATEYLQYVLDAAARAGASSETIVVAPQFLTVEELDAYGLDARVAFWDEGEWKEGGVSDDTVAHPRAGRTSSFAVTEAFVRQIARVAPNLQSLVVVGHSAGAQFVQRFAAGNAVQDEYAGLDLRYVVANPSSYLYFSGERVVDGTLDVFEVPTGIDCPTWYDDYKYGLLELNPYMAAVGADELARRYSTRDVTLLLGADDDDPAAPYLDTSCAAALQGPSRLARGVIFQYHVIDRFGPSIAATHRVAVVPGVGHSPSRMFRSDCGLYRLFGDASFASGCADASGVLAPDPTDAPPSIEGLRFEGAAPNPFNPRTVLRMRASRPDPVVVSILSADGRVVQRFVRVPDASGAITVVWEGRDLDGREVASGVYRVQARQRGEAVHGSVVLLR